jgi:hypothetical protein
MITTIQALTPTEHIKVTTLIKLAEAVQFADTSDRKHRRTRLNRIRNLFLFTVIIVLLITMRY